MLVLLLLLVLRWPAPLEEGTRGSGGKGGRMALCVAAEAEDEDLARCLELELEAAGSSGATRMPLFFLGDLALPVAFWMFGCVDWGQSQEVYSSKESVEVKWAMRAVAESEQRRRKSRPP